MILRVTPSKRPDIKDIVSHPFFTEDTNSTKGSEEKEHSKTLSHNYSEINMKKPKNVTMPYSNVNYQGYQPYPQQMNFGKNQSNSYPFYPPQNPNSNYLNSDKSEKKFRTYTEVPSNQYMPSQNANNYQNLNNFHGSRVGSVPPPNGSFTMNKYRLN